MAELGQIYLPEIDESTKALIREAEGELKDVFAAIDEREAINTRRVLASFQSHRVSARHFAPSTGYGHDDIGRDNLSEIFADVLGTEAALVRPQIVSGTHALAITLMGVLRPGQTLLSGAGKPYDSLEEVIGISGEPGCGSLKDYDVAYKQVDMTPDGNLDIEGILNAIDDTTGLVLIQRSRGYDWRASLSVAQINEAIDAIHARRADLPVMVDNCYGEFTDISEPRADIMAGSLIKNPGGGQAPTGGYVAGRRDLVEKVSYRLTAPGIGAEVGSYAASYQPFYQGFFTAPHTVAQAVKTAALAACVFAKLGFQVHPAYDAPRNDIIEAIRFEDPEKLIAFCQVIQMCSPVDAEALPEPWEMPGYQDPVIMAAGTFVSGASIELSADGPVRAPYIAYLQGGLTYAHGKIAIEGAVQLMKNKGLL